MQNKSSNKVEHAYREWTVGRQLYDHGEYKLAIEKYSDLTPVLKGNGLFLLHYGKCLSMAERYHEAIDVLSESKAYYVDDIWYVTMGNCYEMLGNFSMAEKYYKNGASIIPHRFYPKYLLAILYLKADKNDQAIEVAIELLTRR